MKSFKVRGIVLKEVFFAETHKFITIFAKDYGKISVKAKNARRSKSKFLAGTQLFTYADFMIETRGKYHVLSQVDIIESFYDIRLEYDRLCYANYFLEIADKSLMSDMESNNVLLLLLKTLKVACIDNINLELVARIFELKLLDYSGYRPEVQACIKCGKNVELGSIYFSKEGIACNACVSSEGKGFIKLSQTTFYAIKYILNSDLASLYKFNLDECSLGELRVIRKLLMSEFEFNIKSESFIKV